MRRSLTTLICLLGVGVLLAACGSSSKPTQALASASGSPVGGSAASMIPFADCMRANGVPNFPDPKAGGIQIQSTNGSTVVDGTAVNGPAFQTAMKKCQSKMPRGRQLPAGSGPKIQAAALKYAACMRSHGVPNFPDPQVNTSGGGVGIKIGAPGSQINPNSPSFKSAQASCLPLMRKVLPGGPGPGGAP
jgi:hypothetical protein